MARDAVNVRAGPGTNYAVIGQVTRGQQFTATGRNQAGDWLRFDLDGQTGWVYAPLMTVHASQEGPVEAWARAKAAEEAAWKAWAVAEAAERIAEEEAWGSLAEEAEEAARKAEETARQALEDLETALAHFSLAAAAEPHLFQTATAWAQALADANWEAWEVEAHETAWALVEAVPISIEDLGVTADRTRVAATVTAWVAAEAATKVAQPAFLTAQVRGFATPLGTGARDTRPRQCAFPSAEELFPPDLTATTQPPQESQNTRAQANQTIVAQNAANATAWAQEDQAARVQAVETVTAVAQENQTIIAQNAMNATAWAQEDQAARVQAIETVTAVAQANQTIVAQNAATAIAQGNSEFISAIRRDRDHSGAW